MSAGEEGKVSHFVVGRRACAAVAGAAVLALTAVVPAKANAAAGIKRLGSVNVEAAAAAAKPAAYRPALRNLPSFKQFAQLEQRRGDEDANRLAPPALKPPTVAGQAITSIDPLSGFESLDIRDQVFSQGFEVEPPDQGLCGGKFAGTTYLWGEVNLAIALYDTDENQYTPPALGLNVLYGVPPAFDPATGTFGPFLSDPKCYFDPDTGRWFHTVLEADVDPATGDLTGGANTLLAVSRTRDPLGDYTVYAIDAAHANCVLCIGDQPLLGADGNGLYISTAEYDLAPPQGSPGFFGAQIYAIDKAALATGANNPTLVHFEPGTQFTGTVQPASSPGGRYETAQQGTEYFMSAQDCEPPDCHVDADSLENTIHVWALIRTSTLRSSHPNLRLFDRTVSSEVYGTPIPQRQKNGRHPLGQSHNEPVPTIEANDARMNQVVYASGRLWGGVNTIANPGPRDGIAWFSVNPDISASGVRADIAQQGYVAGKDRGSFVSFPSIGVNDAGKGVIAYSLMGDQYFPSAAQSEINRNGLTSGVQIVRAGFKPEDGFTCYEEEGNGPNCRWGDYSAAFALPTGELWSATELIGDNARTQFANWSTFIWSNTP
jgi:hypothetical protein